MGNLARRIESRKLGFDQSQIMQPTSSTAMHPFQSLELQTYQAFPNIQKAGIIPVSLREDIEQKTPTLLKEIRSSIGTLKKLMQLEKAETELHTTHRDYQLLQAQGEAERKSADVDLASGLIKLQAKYNSMANKLDFAAQTTEDKITKSNQQYEQRFTEYLAKLQGDK